MIGLLITAIVFFVLGVVAHEWASTRQPKREPQPIDLTGARRR